MGELTVVEKVNAVQLFDGKSVDPLIEKIRKEALSLVPDITTAKGRKEIASVAHSVARAKTMLDNAGKDLVSGIKEQAKVIDSERKKLRDSLDALKTEIREPLTRWEQEEEDRKNRLLERLESFIGLQAEYDEDGNVFSSEITGKRLAEVKAIAIDDSWEEYVNDAAKAKDTTISILEKYHAKRIAEEEQAAELARLKKEAEERAKRDEEERLRKEGEERARKEAEEKARLEAERVERERKEKEEEERKERERIEAEKQAAIEAQKEAERKAREAEEEAKRQAEEARLEAERKAKEAEENAKRQAEEAARKERERIEAERKAEEEAAKKREADKKHKAAINNAAASAICKVGLSKEDAKRVVAAIATGKVPHVSIRY